MPIEKFQRPYSQNINTFLSSDKLHQKRRRKTRLLLFRCKQSISRVLFRFRGGNHLSRPLVAKRLQRLNPEGSAGRIIPSLFGLAPCGVYQAARLLGHWCALAAPFHPYLLSQAVSVSMALSRRLPSPDVIRHTALWSPDFPLAAHTSASDCLSCSQERLYPLRRKASRLKETPNKSRPKQSTGLFRPAGSFSCA